jgi:hypothetical protein
MKKIELSQEYLQRRYVDEVATVEEIAEECGCSVANVRKRIKDWRCLRGRALRSSGKLRSWNLGLTKETDERLANISDSRKGEGNPMAGKKAWNNGLTSTDDPRVAKAVIAMRAGFEQPETREKMAEAKRGKTREQSNRWRGGTTKIGPYTEHRKTVDGRRVYVHRHVAEQSLGRRLDRLEHVHHVDRTEGNNDPLNLLVMSEADHAKLHGAIYRNECDTRAEQIAWLVANQIPFEEVR